MRCEYLPESLADIIDALAEELGDAALALRVVRCLAERFSGEQIYIASAGTVERIERNAEIRRLYDGTYDGAHGVRALARRYRLSRSTVHRIVSEKE